MPHAATAAYVAADLYDFDSASGYGPDAGVIADGKGRVFGTTPIGGNGSCEAQAGCGTVYMLTPAGKGRSWSLSVIYNFQNNGDGYFPRSPVILGPHGNLYGYTGAGTYGTVYQLSPPAKKGGAWTFQILYTFSGGADGNLDFVYGPLVWRDGELFGVASGGSTACGSLGCGSVFRLTPATSGNSWKFKTLYRFTGGSDSGTPTWIAGEKGQNTLYVATGLGNGAIAQLMPSGGGPCNEAVIAQFEGGADGSAPYNLLLTSGGTIYGTASTGYTGNVFQLSQSGGIWTRSTIAKVAMDGYGPTSLAFGNNGTLIGAVYGDVDFVAGGVFQLSPNGSQWKYKTLMKFSLGSSFHQPNNVVVGYGGNLFGDTNGGDYDSGAAFELEPSR